MTIYLKNKYTPTALPLSDQKKCGHVRKNRTFVANRVRHRFLLV